MCGSWEHVGVHSSLPKPPAPNWATCKQPHHNLLHRIIYMHWPGGMKEYLTALLLMRLPSTMYAHWMRCPSNARTLSIPVMVVVCSVLVWTVYTAPGKAVTRAEPLSTVLLCIHSGGMTTSLCLQMRVSWSEQSPPWSSRETEKAAVRCRNKVLWIMPKKEQL